MSIASRQAVHRRTVPQNESFSGIPQAALAAPFPPDGTQPGDGRPRGGLQVQKAHTPSSTQIAALEAAQQQPPHSPAANVSATQKLHTVQSEVADLKQREAELRSLLAEVCGKAADELQGRISHAQEFEDTSGDVRLMVGELEALQEARAYAQTLQELQGLLRHLEKQLRAVDRAAAAGDLATYLTTLSEAVASHNTVAENCDTLAQLPSRGLPAILQQHADAAVGRATSDQERLLGSLRKVLRSQLAVVGWPPSLASSSSQATTAPAMPVVDAAGSWQGLESAAPEALDGLIRILAALIALQRSVQRSSFELALDSQLEDPPSLWAMEELVVPLADRLQRHFTTCSPTDRIDKPEWLLGTVRRLAVALAPQLLPLTPALDAHELQAAYHIPFEFVRALRSALQVILKKHVLPRLVAAKQPGLWLHFVEAAVTFERELAPLRGITVARHPAEDAPELWRRGSCIALVCSVQEFRDAWWDSEREDALQQLRDIMDADSAWSPAHLSWQLETPVDDWDDISAPGSSRGQEAWQSEFWAPQASEGALQLVAQLAAKCAWLPDDAVQDFAGSVPQEVLRALRERMNRILKTAEDFREEVGVVWAPRLGGVLCGAHHLEHSLRESDGPLLLLDLPGDEAVQTERSVLAVEADAFGALKQKGALRLSKAALARFTQDSAAYFRKHNIQSFALSDAQTYRVGAVSPQLRLAVDELEATLTRLGQVLDAVLFRDVWRGLAAALNRLFFNVLITEARFSPQGARRVAADCAALLGAFQPYTAKPAAHFRELTEACSLLTAELQVAAGVARQLAVSPPEQAVGLLKTLGVSRLTPQQSAHVLAQRI